jgi:hypothetical protein
VAFLALFIYLNGAETDKARAKMAAPATGRRGTPPSLNGYPLPPLVGQLRGFLHRRRIRLNLVSGVEFEMAVFVVAPLFAAAFGAGAIMWVTGVAAGLLIAFELALIARFWLTARSYDLRAAQRPMPAQRTDRSPVDDRLHHPA